MSACIASAAAGEKSKLVGSVVDMGLSFGVGRSVASATEIGNAVADLGSVFIGCAEVVRGQVMRDERLAQRAEDERLTEGVEPEDRRSSASRRCSRAR